ncbi:MAG: hypothetical protein ACFFD2_06935 [Promethearchaeota archaeon]
MKNTGITNLYQLIKGISPQGLLPNQRVNLTISTNSNENVSRNCLNLQVFSGTSCLTILNATAFANETVFLTLKNTGAYNETIDHIWLNGEIFDIYSSPNPNNLFLQRNQTLDLMLEFAPTILNLNITSPYDPLPLHVNISLLLDSRNIDLESQHEQQLLIQNNYNFYNISITDEIYSNETIFLNVTNTGLKSIEVSDIWINNISTTTFYVSDSPVLSNGTTKMFNISSNLNLNYLDTAQIIVRTYEGPYALITRSVGPSGKINITWSEAYPNNQTILLNVTNLQSTSVTIKSILINSIEALDFGPLDDSFHPLPTSFNTILGNSYQLFNVTMTYTQFLNLDHKIPLSINITTYEGAYSEHNASWAYIIRINKVFAFINNTVTVYLENIGRYPVTINNFYLNSSSTPFTLVSGSLTPLPGTISIFNMTSSIPLLFSNELEVEAIANYTISLENISASYYMPFVLYDGPNITIIQGWPNTVAFDNITTTNNDTVYITVMNTGNMTFNITNFLLNDTVHQFERVDNQTAMIMEPYQIITFINQSITFDVSANSGDFLEINITTDIQIDTSYNLSTLTSLRVLHDQPNITLTANATYYSSPFFETFITLNIINYGNETLSINLLNDIKIINMTNSYEFNYDLIYSLNTIILKPGESQLGILLKVEYDPPKSGVSIKIEVTGKYDIGKEITSQVIIVVN